MQQVCHVPDGLAVMAGPYRLGIDANRSSHFAASLAVDAREVYAALCRFAAATDARTVLEHISCLPAVDRDAWLRTVADVTRSCRGLDGRSGAYGRFAGYLFEHLDTRRFNIDNAVHGRRLVPRVNPRNVNYDASRFSGNRFTGAIQQKLNGRAAAQAAAKIEVVKPGSAPLATLRVPADQADVARQIARGRIRVEASAITTAENTRVADLGLNELAGHGTAATGATRQALRAAGPAALWSAGIGAVLDAPRLVRRTMKPRHFAARRGVDAVEAGVVTATSTVLAASVTTVVEGIALAGAAGATTATTVLASPVIIPVATAVVVGAGVHQVTKRVRRRIDAHYTTTADVTEQAAAPCPSAVTKLPDIGAELRAILDTDADTDATEKRAS